MANDGGVTEALEMHANGEFIDGSIFEMYFVAECDDDGADRLGYYFGPECPLPLWKGAVQELQGEAPRVPQLRL